MNIQINRTSSEPPSRDYSSRDGEDTRVERLAAIDALRSLRKGQSVYFTGTRVTRGRINNYLAAVARRGTAFTFATARIPGGIGVWRTH